MLLPIRDIRTKVIEIDSRERRLGTGQIPQRPAEHRASAAQVAARLVMESDRQLNQALQMFLRGGSTELSAPEVFEDFVGVEEVSGVEGIGERVDPDLEFPPIHHCGYTSTWHDPVHEC
jgi:hypothetical protein